MAILEPWETTSRYDLQARKKALEDRLPPLNGLRVAVVKTDTGGVVTKVIWGSFKRKK